MLTLTLNDIKKDLPELEGITNNYKDWMAPMVYASIVPFLHRQRIVFEHPSSKPQFVSLLSKGGKHVFKYTNPEMRVICRLYGERHIINEIWIQYKYIE